MKFLVVGSNGAETTCGSSSEAIQTAATWSSYRFEKPLDFSVKQKILNSGGTVVMVGDNDVEVVIQKIETSYKTSSKQPFSAVFERETRVMREYWYIYLPAALYFLYEFSK